MNCRPQCCLLLEDDPDDQKMFLEAVGEVSAETACYVTSNGVEAMEVLENGTVNPDLIFSDVNMPLMDGLEFLGRIRKIERFKDTPFILYTGDYSEPLIEKAKKLGATAIFSKTRIGALREILKKYFVLESITFV